MTTKLRLEDIADLRAYEKERETLRPAIMALKATRRVPVGPFVVANFENRDTLRYQIQEMARTERMLREDQIQGELDTYNPLVPGRDELTATVFIELTSKDQLVEWLPKLVGIERSISLQIDNDAVWARVESGHDEQLTREMVTASVHYVQFHLTPEQSARLLTATVVLRVNHENYSEEAILSAETKTSLARDLTSIDQ